MSETDENLGAFLSKFECDPSSLRGYWTFWQTTGRNSRPIGRLYAVGDESVFVSKWLNQDQVNDTAEVIRLQSRAAGAVDGGGARIPFRYIVRLRLIVRLKKVRMDYRTATQRGHTEVELSDRRDARRMFEAIASQIESQCERRVRRLSVMEALETAKWSAIAAAGLMLWFALRAGAMSETSLVTNGAITLGAVGFAAYRVLSKAMKSKVCELKRFYGGVDHAV